MTDPRRSSPMIRAQAEDIVAWMLRFAAAWPDGVTTDLTEADVDHVAQAYARGDEPAAVVAALTRGAV